jgi:PAS domain S-box-containing protein
MDVPLNLLIVEDSLDDAELLVHELRRAGYAPRWQRVDTEADFLIHLKSPPDLVISDFSMPQFNGIQAVELLRQRGLDIPFILVSGSAGEERAVEAMKRGATDYLLKDRIARLGSAVKHALEEKRLREETHQTRAELAQKAAALQTSETRLAGIINSAMDGIITVTHEQRIILFNPAAEKMFGYRAEQLLGKPLDILLPHRARAAHAGHVHNFGETGVTSRRMGALGTIAGVRADGTEFPVEASISQVETEGQRLFTVILRDITERKRLEAAVAAAAEEERGRIARDLHDGLGQQLGGALFLSDLLHRDLKKREAVEGARAGQVHTLVVEALEQARELARGLYPVPPEPDGLMTALQNLADRVTRDRKIGCTFDTNAAVLLSDQTIATHLYRIGQEAVNNALKHSGTARIEIQLNQTAPALELSVQDFGKGLPAGTPAPGLGMQTMRHRANLIGARLTVQNASQGGVQVSCSVKRTWPAPQSASPPAEVQKPV